jgi:Domain of unknown function (DUF5666)
MNRMISSALAGVCAMFLASGCGTVGDIFGGGGTPAPGPSPDVRGTVEHVDPQTRTLSINADNASQLSLRTGNRVDVIYDASTVVQYQGRQYRPEDLERGDRVEALVQRSGDRLLVRTITVISSVSSAGGAPGGVDLRDFDAIVRNVDASIRTIELTPVAGQGGPVIVAYDNSTRVDYRGRDFRPVDLERGDRVRVTTRSSGDRPIADRIVVTGNASGDTAVRDDVRQMRGTIRAIDTAARVIQIDQVSWAQGFNPEAGANPTSVGYDANTVVEFQGKRYGIANLERGDVIDIDVVDQAGNRLLARRIVVARSS